MSSKIKSIFTDGGVYDDLNLIKWAFIVVDKDKLIYEEKGDINSSGRHQADVETAESEALFRAVTYVKEHPGNYTIFTDSRSFLDKIQDNCNNATKNPRVNFIKVSLEQIKNNPNPVSLDIKFKPRRSSQWMERVDDMCNKSSI